MGLVRNDLKLKNSTSIYFQIASSMVSDSFSTNNGVICAKQLRYFALAMSTYATSIPKDSRATTRHIGRVSIRDELNEEHYPDYVEDLAESLKIKLSNWNLTRWVF